MKTSGRILILFLALFFRVEPAEAACPDTPLLSDPVFQKEARPAIDLLYNRQPDAGTERLETWMNRCPNHPVWDLWSAMVLWWRVLENLEQDVLDDSLVEQLKKAEQRGIDWTNRHPDSPDGWFVRALSNGLLARLHANRGRWVRSILVAGDAQRASEALEERLPGLADHQLARGLTLYYSAWLPDRYIALRPFRWAMPEGDRERGLELLTSASRQALFVHAEATYFAGLILLRYEDRPTESLALFRDLANSYSENVFYQRILIQALLEVARSAEQTGEYFRARELYRESLDRSESGRIQEETRELRQRATRALERLGTDVE